MQQEKRIRSFKFVAAAATATIAAAVFAVGAPPATAAPVDHIVGTSGDTFTPNAVPAVVNIGDTITFNGLDGHNATSTAGSAATFASPAGGASFVYTTTTAGKHTFECTFHSGMTGSFTVAAGGAAPAAAAPAAPVAAAPAAGGATVNTSGDTFTPSTLPGVVNIGDKITFNGLKGHNATSTAGSVGTFASPPGAASFVYTTTTAGKHTYECTYHSGMTGSFTVAAGGAAPAAGVPAAPAAGVPAAPAAGVPAVSGSGGDDDDDDDDDDDEGDDDEGDDD